MCPSNGGRVRALVVHWHADCEITVELPPWQDLLQRSCEQCWQTTGAINHFLGCFVAGILLEFVPIIAFLYEVSAPCHCLKVAQG